MLNTTEITITKKGNTVGFTSAGESVTGKFMPNRKAWFIAVYNEAGRTNSLDTRNRSFGDKAAAADYAATLVDAKVTEEKKWW